MEFNIEIRKKQLENLKQFINSAQTKVSTIIEKLGMTEEEILKDSQEPYVCCPINPNHQMPSSVLNKHIESCKLKRKMCFKDEPPLSEPNYIPESTIIIDEATKAKIFNNALAVNPQMRIGWRRPGPEPATYNDYIATYSADERLVMYDYAVASTKGPPQVPEFNVEPRYEPISGNTTLSIAELKARERDVKRRRVKYKSVHTNRKNVTEITRELINNQMELYEDWLQRQKPNESHTNNSNCGSSSNNNNINNSNNNNNNDISNDNNNVNETDGATKIVYENNERIERQQQQQQHHESSSERASPPKSPARSQCSDKNSSHKSRSRNRRSKSKTRSRSRSRSYQRSRDRSRSRSKSPRRNYRSNFKNFSQRRFSDRRNDYYNNRDRNYRFTRHHSRDRDYYNKNKSYSKSFKSDH